MGAARAVMVLALIPAPALGESDHLLTSALTGVQFQTSLGNSVVNVRAPLGVSVGYVFQWQRRLNLFVQYSLATLGGSILLHGATFGADVALMGGISGEVIMPDGSSAEIEFPYRLGLYLAGTQQSYNLGRAAPEKSLSFEKTIPTTGSLFGPQAGISFSFPWSPQMKLGAQAGVLLPTFPDEENQKGRVYSVSLIAALGI